MDVCRVIGADARARISMMPPPRQHAGEVRELLDELPKNGPLCSRKIPVISMISGPPLT
jgi:hypothetical protein